MARLSATQLSFIMSRIRSKNTKPELIVRSLAHSLGYRFRLHRKELPGNPDMVFPKHHKVIFVHGCFWHQHKGCRAGKLPTQNIEYWHPKLQRNIDRDKKSRKALTKLGWKSLIIWECEAKDERRLAQMIKRFLSGPT